MLLSRNWDQTAQWQSPWMVSAHECKFPSFMRVWNEKSSPGPGNKLKLFENTKNFFVFNFENLLEISMLAFKNSLLFSSSGVIMLFTTDSSTQTWAATKSLRFTWFREFNRFASKFRAWSLSPNSYQKPKEFSLTSNQERSPCRSLHFQNALGKCFPQKQPW